MSDVPLPLLKELENMALSDKYNNSQYVAITHCYYKVESALRKFQKGNLDLSPSNLEYANLNCCKCGKLPYISVCINKYDTKLNKIYCPDCWFKECFGELSKIKIVPPNMIGKYKSGILKKEADEK